MRSLGVLALLTLARGAEVEFTSVLSAIQDELRSATIPGVGRKLAVEGLLNQVQLAGRIDENGKKKMNDAKGVLQTVLGMLTADQGADQTGLDTLDGEYAGCVSAGQATDDEHSQNVTTAKGTHDACRTAEEALFNDDDTKCGDLVSWLNGLGNPYCQKPESLVANIDLWDQLLTDGHTWFTDHHGPYITKRDACLLSTGALADKVIVCDADQVAYENEFCEWYGYRVARCGVRTDCFSDALSDHRDEVTRVLPLAAARVASARIISWVICLITNLVESGTTDIDACQATKDASYQSYNNTFPAEPAQTDCSYSDMSSKPGDATWYSTAYNHLSSSTPHSTTSGVDCVEP